VSPPARGPVRGSSSAGLALNPVKPTIAFLGLTTFLSTPPSLDNGSRKCLGTNPVNPRVGSLGLGTGLFSDRGGFSYLVQCSIAC
jgi:hypothetical protein